MEYVIYGAGYRGKKLFEYINADNILAFIDADKEKQGKKYCGKPVISIEEYKRNYESCFIIITPVYCKNIKDILTKQNICQYSNLIDMPAEFFGYGDCSFDNCYGRLKCAYNKRLCVYGINAFSFLIYDFLKGDREVFICPEKNCSNAKIEWVTRFYPTIKLKNVTGIQKDEIILKSTVGNEEEKHFNDYIDLFEYANNNKHYWNKKLLKFKKAYAEKKCFIVATGPSLRIDDLRKLAANKIFCFGVNSIIKIENEWIPDGYVVTDSYFISNNIQHIEDYNCKIKFIGDSCKEYWIKKRKNSYKIHVVNTGAGIDFSEEICQKLYSGYNGGGTVTYVCLQLAAYMGFKEIYLIGADCNYAIGSKNNHFVEDEEVDNKNHGTDLMIKAYAFAKIFADKHGIKIFNATRGGALEVFERVDFDTLF